MFLLNSSTRTCEDMDETLQIGIYHKCTEVRFASFLSGGFTTMTVIECSSSGKDVSVNAVVIQRN